MAAPGHVLWPWGWVVGAPGLGLWSSPQGPPGGRGGGDNDLCTFPIVLGEIITMIAI